MQAIHSAFEKGGAILAERSRNTLKMSRDGKSKFFETNLVHESNGKPPRLEESRSLGQGSAAKVMTIFTFVVTSSCRSP